jgi:subtilisin family serine protease
MSIRRFRSFFVIAVILFCLAAPVLGAEYILEIVPGANAAQIAVRYGLVLVRPLSEHSQTVFLVTSLQPVSPPETKEILADQGVAGFEPDQDIHSPETPPPSPVVPSVAALAGAIQNRAPLQYYGATVRSSYVQQPSAALINLPEALQYGSGGGIVAVIDTGVDPSHPALKGVLVPGYDFIRNQPGFANELADLDQSTVAILDQSTVAILDKTFAAILNQSTVAILDQSTVAILDGNKLPDDFGHGTMVAGLIHLVAPTARIMPLKAFAADGSADLSNIVRAIYYAVDNHAVVINMSFSSRTPSASLTSALQYAWAHGVICVASVGNNGREVMVYPAATARTIGVASTSPLDKRSVFSNYGDCVRMAAPGEALITTYPGNNYAGVWGTSFSTALISGAAALMAQIYPNGSPYTVTDALDHGHKLLMEGLGAARLDIYSSVQYYLLNPPSARPYSKDN